MDVLEIITILIILVLYALSVLFVQANHREYYEKCFEPSEEQRDHDLACSFFPILNLFLCLLPIDDN